MKIYIGWDPRDALAFEVCAYSIRRRASIPVDIIPLKMDALYRSGVFRRSWRMDENGQRWDERDGKPFNTEFSFTRFAVPLLEEYRDGPVLFIDPDMLFLSDVAELLALYDGSLGVQCVQHEHYPMEKAKAVGLQMPYTRKNWSSLMLMNPARCTAMTRYRLNNATGLYLHSLCWAERIGALPSSWNWLEGWDDPEAEKKVIHYTRGTPDFEGYENVDFADLWREELACMRTAA